MVSNSGSTKQKLDALLVHNEAMLRATRERVKLQDVKHKERLQQVLATSPLSALESRIEAALQAAFPGRDLQIQFDYIDREKFAGDLAVKLRGLLTEGGPRGFVAKYQATVLEVLTGASLADVIKQVDPKGMYLNVTLQDAWFREAALTTAKLGVQFGASSALRDRRFVIDYSSPNVAKALHAGHIRSTIIGEVLSNLLEGSGAQVFRVNHINDFGGFGFILEGYRRFAKQFPAELSDPAKLVEIYKIRRSFESVQQSKAALEELDPKDKQIIERYLPTVRDRGAFEAQYADYVKSSDARFAKLELGDAEEVELWAKMVQWSLTDFEPFYRSLNIHIPYVLGESFYFHASSALLETAQADGKAVIFSSEAAEAEVRRLSELIAAEKITEQEGRALQEAARKDVGALVVPLADGHRLVVQRSDGRSIYATRDLGAIKVRREIFNPTDIVYVVGQEQRHHFAQLFEAAQVLGLCGGQEDLRLEHKYFGFYVDAKTGKKLASRDMVAGVNRLLEASFEFFRKRVAERGDLAQAELDSTAQQLSVGSVVFNDLKQDVKGRVDFEVGCLDTIVEGFEKSGGAYVVYTACRARSILRKVREACVNIPAPKPDFQVSGEEAKLLLAVERLPQVVASAAKLTDPSVLVQYLLTLAQLYNSYYNRVRVIQQDGSVDADRLAITSAVQTCLENGLRLCHVECPERI